MENQFTDEQIEVVAKVLAGATGKWDFYEYPYNDHDRKRYRDQDRAALEAVAAITPAPEAVKPSVHYEYGYGWDNGRKELALSRRDAFNQASIRPHGARAYKRVQKRNGQWPAGPWLPVEGESE